MQVTSLLITTCVAAFAIYSIRRRPVWIDDLIEEAGETFLKPDEEGNSFIDLLAARFGKGFRMSLLAQKSGEVRHQKMIENRVFEAIKDHNPEIKLALTALDKFGLGDLATPENMPALIQVANKYGLFGVLGNTPGKSRSDGVM